MSVLALIVNHFDVVQVGVSPVHHAIDQVKCDAVWEDNLAVNQLGAVLTIHVTALHPRRGPIVCEKHFAVAAEEWQKEREISLSLGEQKRIFHQPGERMCLHCCIYYFQFDLTQHD